ncbi:hypothetical protein C2E23DRAFT_752344 [Lenzites betulinus]|nr:hypothetical protein C2E23DRAFT_752344 [Lenzites betulinus]
MPAPAVYIAVAVIGVVAVGFAFHELVYEPHIAPKVEVWAESFLERRRQKKRQRQGPVLANPHPFETGDENHTRRSSDSIKDKKDDYDQRQTSIELGHLASKQPDARSRDAGPSVGLRQRKPVPAIDESTPHIPYPAMDPTHVLFDTTEPPSPGGRSSSGSSISSRASSPLQPSITISEPQPRVAKSSSPLPRALSPRLPTPMSNYSPISSRAITPSTLSERSPFSSGRPTPDLGVSQVIASAYNTPLGGSVISERGRSPAEAQAYPGSRIQSPFSDIHSVDARSSPEQVYARSPITSPRVQSPSIGSDVTMDSDDEFDILSPRSGMFSPPTQVHNFYHFDAPSQHGSDASWASVGRRSPEF